jgi:hypothetical protein
MKKLFLSVLVISSMVSCKVDTNKSESTQFFVISKEINNNADNIIICMQQYYSKIDSLTLENQLTVNNVNLVKREISIEMKQYLKESEILSKKLNKLDLTSKQYTVCQRILTRIQTSGAGFLVVDDLIN